MLRHASEQPQLDLGARLLKSCEVAQTPDHALLGMLADRAGVQQDDVGLLELRCGRVTGSAQDPSNQLGIRDIHLASVGFEPDSRLRAV